jgi:hypothetical protein
VTSTAAPIEPANRGLSDLSQRELGELLRAVEASWLSFPVAELALSNAGLASRHCTAVAQQLRGLNQDAARIVLEVALAERVHRPPPYLDLVWTGPEAQGTTREIRASSSANSSSARPAA